MGFKNVVADFSFLDYIFTVYFRNILLARKLLIKLVIALDIIKIKKTKRLLNSIHKFLSLPSEEYRRLKGKKIKYKAEKKINDGIMRTMMAMIMIFMMVMKMKKIMKTMIEIMIIMVVVITSMVMFIKKMIMAMILIKNNYNNNNPSPF